MQAIEFNALIEKDTIRLPVELAAWQGKAVRVILLADDTVAKQEDGQVGDDECRAQAITRAKALLSRPVCHYLSAARLDTRGFRFDREEANER
jgi:hypothetical protein